MAEVSSATNCWHSLVPATKRTTTPGGRIAYSFAEFADKVGKERTWVYRQVQKGRLRAVTGYGTAMIPVSEIDRIFSSNEADAIGATA